MELAANVPRTTSAPMELLEKTACGLRITTCWKKKTLGHLGKNQERRPNETNV